MDWSKPYNHQLFYRSMWKPAAKQAGLSTLRFHDLRHTFASLMAREGVKPHELAKLLGHKDATVTLAIYTHIYPDDALGFADLLGPPPAFEEDTTVMPLDTKRSRLEIS